MQDFNLRLKKTGKASIRVTRKNTALKFGSGSVNVFATPAMIGLMEKASINCVDIYLPEGYASVGTKIDIRHMAPTPVGMNVTATSELIEIDGRKLKFKVQAFDEREKIGEGAHSRYIIELTDFISRAGKKRI